LGGKRKEGLGVGFRKRRGGNKSVEVLLRIIKWGGKNKEDRSGTYVSKIKTKTKVASGRKV